MNRRKNLWIILFLLLAGFSIWAVVSQSQNFSLEEFHKDIATANKGWLTLAIISMLGFIIFEGLALQCIVKELTGHTKRWHGFIYSSADIYFSAITPSATGGQPMSAFFMMKDGIPGPIVTVTLILNLIMYTLSSMTVGLISILFRPQSVNYFCLVSKIIILAGLGILIIMALFFFLLLKKEKIIYAIGDSILRICGKIKLIRHVDRKREKLNKTMADYEECVRVAHGKTKMLLKAYFLNLMQRVTLMLVTVFVFLATGGSVSKSFDVWSIQCLTSIGTNCVPIPGAMGVADYLLLDGFHSLPNVMDPTNLELLSRSLSFYCLILFSGVTVLIGYFKQKKRK